MPIVFMCTRSCHTLYIKYTRNLSIPFIVLQACRPAGTSGGHTTGYQVNVHDHQTTIIAFVVVIIFLPTVYSSCPSANGFPNFPPIPAWNSRLFPAGTLLTDTRSEVQSPLETRPGFRLKVNAFLWFRIQADSAPSIGAIFFNFLITVYERIQFSTHPYRFVELSR